MFYCMSCADKKEWPETLHKSVGKCEVCGETHVCNDKQSKYLPMKEFNPAMCGWHLGNKCTYNADRADMFLCSKKDCPLLQ